MQSYTRRKLKEDKFAETAQGAFSWAGEHRTPVMWATGLLLAAVVIAVGAYAWINHQSQQASYEYGNALATFNAQIVPAGTPAAPGTTTFTSIADRGKQAEKEFEAVANKYSLTKPGKLARYMAGAAALQAGDNKAAENDFKQAASSSDKDVAGLAKMGLAALYRNTNRAGEAAKIYKELSDNPTATVSKAEAQLAMAEMYEASDPKEAATLYQQIQKDNANSMAGQIASQRLASIK